METKYSAKEKVKLYSEDVRASLISLKSAIEFTKKKASEEEYLNSYNSSLNCIISKIKSGDVIPASAVTDNKIAFVPKLATTDETFKQAIFTK